MKEIDSKIKKIASEEKFNLPTNYDNDFEAVMKRINEKKEIKRGYSLPILAVAICGVFFVTISVSIIMATNVGAREYYMERFSRRFLEKHTEEISTEYDEEAIKEKEALIKEEEKLKKMIEQQIIKEKEKVSEQIKKEQSKMDEEEEMIRKVLEEEKRKALEEMKKEEMEIDELINSGGAQ